MPRDIYAPAYSQFASRNKIKNSSQSELLGFKSKNYLNYFQNPDENAISLCSIANAPAGIRTRVSASFLNFFRNARRQIICGNYSLPKKAEFIISSTKTHCLRRRSPWPLDYGSPKKPSLFLVVQLPSAIVHCIRH